MNEYFTCDSSDCKYQRLQVSRIYRFYKVLQSNLPSGMRVLQIFFIFFLHFGSKKNPERGQIFYTGSDSLHAGIWTDTV